MLSVVDAAVKMKHDNIFKPANLRVLGESYL